MGNSSADAKALPRRGGEPSVKAGLNSKGQFTRHRQAILHIFLQNTSNNNVCFKQLAFILLGGVS